MRLPACYEVVDAGLHAILLALRQTAARDEPAARQCLIVSDCAAALRMVERAWREGVTWKGQRAGRAGLLHSTLATRARSREAREETAAGPSDIALKRGSNTRKILPRQRVATRLVLVLP